jgi:sarcosine oxidase subunit gamma
VPERIYAFDAYAGGVEITARIGAGIALSPLRPHSVLNVRGVAADAELARTILGTCGVVLPREPNTATGSDNTRALWLGPDEWLIVSERQLEPPCGSAGSGTFVDVSHGRAALRLAGPNVRDALAKGCPLDLHPPAFEVNRCAQTAIAKVSVILDHVQPEVFDVYCPRSYAGSFWHWLVEACAEYGCNVTH